MSSEPNELDKKIQSAAELSQKITNALKKASKNELAQASEEFNSIIKNNENEEEERTSQAENKREARRNEIRKQWKRY
ncbi:MAG: hypothetical protein RMY16_17075 [Nostoc sp. DedQUE12b]|uniref:hypothetical protein n=1 Tax=Nostoc sp. DedQUE12b TaxID=3075398 RepID=UPI002AD3AE17|nr:hypothetical protein [Nostoc sp. DedQUE12b]MDZ8087249.1 hypothetical protein [Nostoc sp. DedQUE12b]